MLINSPDNGASEIPGTSNDSLFVFLAGPIRHWWAPGVEGTLIHRLYMSQRDLAHQMLSENFLVYAPHRAWRGPWNEAAQNVNNEAVKYCHALVWLYVPNITASGTAEEIALAASEGIPTFQVTVDMGASVYHQMHDVIDNLFELDKLRHSNG